MQLKTSQEEIKDQICKLFLSENPKIEVQSNENQWVYSYKLKT